MSLSTRVFGAGLGVGLALATGAAHAALPAGSTLLLDRPSGDAALPFDGADYSIISGHRSLSADGQRAVFESEGDALALSTGGLRTQRYVYVRDRAAGTTVNVCTSSAGVLGDKGCANSAISPNGRYVVFASSSTNLGGPVPNSGGLYVKDLQTGATTLMSRANGGAGAVDNGYPSSASVADNGSIAFVTYTGLDPLDNANARADVYTRTLAGVTTLLSKAGGVLGDNSSDSPDISGDGTLVAFVSRASNLSAADGNSRPDVYTATTAGGAPSLKSRVAAVGAVGNGESTSPSLSQDGLELAFETTSTNLFASSDTNNATDVVLRKEQPAPGNTPVSVVDGTVSTLLPFGGSSPRISATGAYVAFSSPDAAGWEGTSRVALRAPATSSTKFVSRRAGLAGAIVGASPGGVSTDGNTVGFGSSDLDDNGSAQVWARTVDAGTNDRVSRPTGGTDVPQAERGTVQDISADGRFAVFLSAAAGLTPDANLAANQHVYLRDSRNGTTIQLDRAGGPGGAAAPAGVEEAHISDDGNAVVFIAYGGGLVQGDGATEAHVYVWHRSTNQLTLEDRDANGSPVGVGAEDGLDISADGNRVAFITAAGIDAADTNAKQDVYVRDLPSGQTLFASRRDGAAGAALPTGSERPHLDADGSVVAFDTDAKADPSNDANTDADVYVRDLSAGRTILVSAKDGASGAGNGFAYVGSISANGDRVTFQTKSSDLSDGDVDTEQDVHQRQIAASRTVWVSRPTIGAGNDDYSGGRVEMTADGRFATFESSSTKLLAGAKAGSSLYLRDIDGGATTRLLDPSPYVTMMSYNAVLSAGGQCVAFTTNDPAIMPGTYASPDFPHAYLRALGDGCVADDPAATPAPTPIAQGKDTTRPVLSGLKATRTAFGTKGKRKGTKLTFTASEPVTVKLEIAPLSAGKKQGKRCLKPSKVKGKAKACVLEGKAKLVRTAPAAKGKASLAFDGKVGKKAAKKGRYRLILTATDAAGNATAKRLTLDVKVN